MTRPEWAVLLAVLCGRRWEHTNIGLGPVVILWRTEFGVDWLCLYVPEEEAP